MPTRSMRMARARQAPPLRWHAAVGIGGAVLYAAGWAGTVAVPAWVTGPVALVLAGVLARRLLADDVRPSARERPRFDLGASLLVLSLCFGGVRLVEQMGGAGYPLLYGVVAALVAFQERPAGIWSAVAALAVEWSSHLAGTAPGVAAAGLDPSLHVELEWTTLLTRSGYFVGFAGIAEIARRRWGDGEASVGEGDTRQHLLERAREFRLLNAGRQASEAQDRSEVAEHAVIDAVDAVERGIYEKLSLLKSGLDCHTCVLLWFDVGRNHLYIEELVSDADALVDGPIDPAEGVVGSVVRRRDAVALEDLRSGFRGLSYYRSSQPVEQFYGVPLIEEGHLRGVLCVDRAGESPFDDEERELVERVGRSVLRSIEHERIVRDVEEAKFELGQFFTASKRLNEVLGLEDVLGAALESAADVVDYDLGAVTLWDADRGRHRIAAVDGGETLDVAVEEWEGRTFEANNGLVSMAVENRHYLPYGGRLRDGDAVAFTREEPVDELASLLVVPLIVRDDPIGTLVVGAREPGGVSSERREMLEVIANQVAVSLQNARLYNRMEELATTDDLTGLPNRRVFDERLAQTVARHERAQRHFSLAILDIDHFKEVNDTYGHPVGDEVLEEVSAAIESCVREVDVAARYGGEEFAFILEETELEGARRVAERIRRAVEELEFEAEGDEFACTVSVGLAVWPDDAAEADDLVDAADEALYHSKENGRNQVTARCEMR